MKYCMSIITYLKNFFHRIKGCVVMIHWRPGWLGSMFNIIVINISVKAYGENEWGSCFRNADRTSAVILNSPYSHRGHVGFFALRNIATCVITLQSITAEVRSTFLKQEPHSFSPQAFTKIFITIMVNIWSVKKCFLNID